MPHCKSFAHQDSTLRSLWKLCGFASGLALAALAAYLLLTGQSQQLSRYLPFAILMFPLTHLFVHAQRQNGGHGTLIRVPVKQDKTPLS